jgi:hypothetical protein
MNAVLRYFREKRFDTWIEGYGRHVLGRRAAPRVAGPRHLIFAFCDHWEPLWNKVSEPQADARVRFWADAYPRLAAEFRDADGRSPRHSFFFPGEQYKADWLDTLAGFTRQGIGEVEVHLHHDGDTAATLRRDLLKTLDDLGSHGHLSRDPDGRKRYAFIHGNWCLANARADNWGCGVDEEIPLLFDTGCYADFTFPAAPDESQPNIVNQIYWPVGDLAKKRAYESGERARVGEVRRDRILLVEGPLALATRAEKIPVRIENSAITAKEPGTARRIATWVEQNIHVEGRPEWVFVKVHTHGAPELQAASLLGEGGRTMHRALTGLYNDGREWILHYMSAREMFNVAIAAMEGREGNPFDYKDHVLPPPPVSMGETPRPPARPPAS